MSGIFAPRPAIIIDDAPSALATLVTSLILRLRSASPDDSAEIEIGDNDGTVALPRQGAGIRIVFEQPGNPGIEVFRGRVSGATSIGGESGRTISLACRGANGAATPMPGAPVILRAGQDLVSWRVAARLTSPDGAAPADADNDLMLTAQPGLRPGMTVTIRGIRSQVDGDYRIDMVTHQFSSGSGFSTVLSARRS